MKARALIFLAKVGVMMSLLALPVLPVAAVLGSYIYFQAFERILPGVRVGDTRLGRKSIYDAAVILNRDWNLERRVVVGALVRGEIKAWQLSPSELGLRLDPLQTTQRAYQIGHGQDPLSELDQLLTSFLAGHEVQPAVAFDPAVAEAGLRALAAQVDMPPQEATLRWEGDTPMAAPGAPGYVVDVEGNLQSLAADPAGAMARGYVTLEMKDVPPQVVDAIPAVAQAQQLLASVPTLRAYEPISDEHFTWRVPRDLFKGWLKLEPSEQGVQVAIDLGKVAEYLEGLSAELGQDRWIDSARYGVALAEAVREGTDPPTFIVSHRPAAYMVQTGDTLLKIAWELGMPYWKILEANPGLNPDHLLAGQELVIPSKDDMLPLPVIPNKRIVISIGKQRLWVYQEGQEIHEFVISTGIDRSPTQPGVYQVQTHEPNAYASVWDLYMPNFLGIYEAWPGFMNGLHGLPTLSSGRRLWAGVLGRPVSYGCIVLDLDDSEWLYGWAEEGVVVEIIE